MLADTPTQSLVARQRLLSGGMELRAAQLEPPGPDFMAALREADLLKPMPPRNALIGLKHDSEKEQNQPEMVDTLSTN